MKFEEMVKAVHKRLMDDLEVDARDADDAHIKRRADVRLANACRHWLETYDAWEEEPSTAGRRDALRALVLREGDTVIVEFVVTHNDSDGESEWVEVQDQRSGEFVSAMMRPHRLVNVYQTGAQR